MKLLIISLKLEKERTKDFKRGHVLLLLYVQSLLYVWFLERLKNQENVQINRLVQNKVAFRLATWSVVRHYCQFVSIQILYFTTTVRFSEINCLDC